MPPSAPRDGYLLIVGTKVIGVWKKVSFKVTKKGQDYVSDFTPFVWLNPDRGNRVANLVEVTGFTVGDGGYLRFPRKFEAVEFRWKNLSQPRLFHPLADIISIGYQVPGEYLLKEKTLCVYRRFPSASWSV